jgi:hypothetical protein
MRQTGSLPCTRRGTTTSASGRQCQEWLLEPDEGLRGRSLRTKAVGTLHPFGSITEGATSATRLLSDDIAMSWLFHEWCSLNLLSLITGIFGRDGNQEMIRMFLVFQRIQRRATFGGHGVPEQNRHSIAAKHGTRQADAVTILIPNPANAFTRGHTPKEARLHRYRRLRGPCRQVAQLDYWPRRCASSNSAKPSIGEPSHSRPESTSAT